MHIVHLTTVHPPFDTRIFHKQAKTLVEAGYKVTLIAQHEQDEIVDRVKILALPKPRNRFTRIFGLTWRAFRLAWKQRADVYHFHDPELLLVGILLKLFTKGKVIYDVHEDVPQQILTKYWIPTLFRRSLAFLLNIMEKLAARFLDAVVVATEGIAEKFSKHNPIVIHNYPDLAMLPTVQSASAGGNERVLIYVGGISRLRGAIEMVDALECLSNIDKLRLDLIGRFEPACLEAELRKAQGYQHVRFLGWLSPEKVYERLAQADIGLVCLHPEPRYSVALPVKLFEYMAAGLPVVASNFPLWEDIVQGNRCGITVDPLDPREIAEAIEHLLKTPKLRKEMGENGRKAVEEKYNWGAEEKKLLGLYEEISQYVWDFSG